MLLRCNWGDYQSDRCEVRQKAACEEAGEGPCLGEAIEWQGVPLLALSGLCAGGGASEYCSTSSVQHDQGCCGFVVGLCRSLSDWWVYTM